MGTPASVQLKVVTHPSTNHAGPGFKTSELVSLFVAKIPSLKVAAVFSQTLWNLFSYCYRVLWQYFV